jgi:hypothetical protein
MASSLQREVALRLQKKSKAELAALYDETAGFAYRRGLVMGGAEIPFIPVPTFLDKESIRHKMDLIMSVFRALLKLEEFALSDQPAGADLLANVVNDMSDVERTMLIRARRRTSASAIRRHTRFDTFYNPLTDDMSLIEVNSTTPEGVYYHHVMLEATVNFARTLQVDPPDPNGSALHQVIRMFQDEYAARNGRDRLKSIGAIYDREGESTKTHAAEFPRIKELIDSSPYGITVEIGVPADLDVHDGKMYLHGKVVDAIWRNAVDLRMAALEAPGFIEVASNPDRFVVVNDETARFMGNKKTLAHLQDRRLQQLAAMTPSEVGAIEAIVPFCFNPTADTVITAEGQDHTAEEFLMKYQDLFVLKPLIGKHGHGIHFGANRSGWAEVVARALETGSYLAQRFVPYTIITMPVTTITPSGDLEQQEFYQDTNFQVVNGSATGTALCRAAPRTDDAIDVLNVSAGKAALRTCYCV